MRKQQKTTEIVCGEIIDHFIDKCKIHRASIELQHYKGNVNT